MKSEGRTLTTYGVLEVDLSGCARHLDSGGELVGICDRARVEEEPTWDNAQTPSELTKNRQHALSESSS